MELIRYWFEFDLENYKNIPAGIRLGCGVSAFSRDEALAIVQNKIFKERSIPPIIIDIENVDVSTLDANHILPNLLPPVWKGVWFPIGYD